MSFSDDDKEALGEDLDEMKSHLARVEQLAAGMRRDVGTLVTMAWAYIILSVVGAIALVVLFLSTGLS